MLNWLWKAAAILVFSVGASAADPAAKKRAEDIPELTTRVVTFVVRPIIRSALHDPDSLRDFEVLGIAPVPKAPGMSEVVVGYRARNRLGAVGYEEAKFVLSYSSAQRQWIALPVRMR